MPEASAGGFVAVKRRALARAIPMTVHLELTYGCNWRCGFCYNPRRFQAEALTTGEWVGVLDELRRLGTLTVVLTGGEPLFRPDFLEIAEAVRRRAFALRVLTNATLVTEEMAERLAALHPLSVESSLHGATSVTHDATTGVAGSFEAMWRGLGRLRRRGVRLVVKTPLTRHNQTELDQIIALVEGHGLELRIDPTLTPRDDGDGTPHCHRCSDDAVRRLMERLAERGRVPTAQREPGGASCGVGRLTMTIDPGGSVFPCIQWRRGSLGNVRETPLGELWHHAPLRQQAAEEARRVNQRLLSLGEPLASFPYCPGLNHLLTGDALRPDASCVRLAEAAAAARRKGPASAEQAPQPPAAEAGEGRADEAEAQRHGSGAGEGA
jgi:MoaA/NifB/PqqE/SkfB family radical SAM enzyme